MRDLLVAQAPNGTVDFDTFMATHATEEKMARAVNTNPNERAGFYFRHPRNNKQVGSGRFQTREQYLAVLPLAYHTADAVRPPAQ